MVTIILLLLGISLLACAKYHEVLYYYRRSVIFPRNTVLDAETARQLTNLSISYNSRTTYVMLGHIFTKKTLLIVASCMILFLNCVQLIISCPLEMPELLTLVLGSYFWIITACYILDYCLRHYRAPFILSLTTALVLPVVAYGILYFFAEITNLYNVIHDEIIY